MISKILKISNYMILVAIIILFIFLFIKNTEYNKSKKIKFVNPLISEIFYSKLPNDLGLLKNNLNNAKSINIKKDQIFIDVSLHMPFAINKNDNKIIFQNGIFAKSIFFDDEFINKIKLSDISPSTFEINESLINLLIQLNVFKSLRKIELIDNRRYNVYLFDGRKIMLPKAVNNNLIIFLNNNLNIMLNDQNFSDYLDLRNFASNSIRMK